MMEYIQKMNATIQNLCKLLELDGNELSINDRGDEAEDIS